MKKASLATDTAARLREMIAQGDFEPGQLFATEASLTEQLGVSRVIMREAISRLQALGILESRQRVGLLVANPDPIGLFAQAFDCLATDAATLQQLSELRYSLELGAINIAVTRASDEQIARLTEIADESDRKIRNLACDNILNEVELRFHATILEATGNEMLTRMVGIIDVYFSRRAAEVEAVGLADEHIGAEHKMIARAFASRNAELARALLEEHLSDLIAP